MKRISAEITGTRKLRAIVALLTIGVLGASSFAEAKQIEWIDKEAGVRRITMDFDNGYQAGRAPRPSTLAGVKVDFGASSSSGTLVVEKASKKMPDFLGKGESPSDALGKFFLTDSDGGVKDAFDYAINFSEEVANVKLDGFDFRADDGGAIGDVVTLNAYDSMNRLIGSDNYTISGKELDGNIVTFGVNATGIRRVELINSGIDGSTGIDNLIFDVGVAAAPEPAEWAMIGMGVLVLGVAYRRRQASQAVAIG